MVLPTVRLAQRKQSMARPRIGVWFIGAKGGVASTATVGLVALKKGLVPQVGLTGALPAFARLELADWSDFVVGGHEIRYAPAARIRVMG